MRDRTDVAHRVAKRTSVAGEPLTEMATSPTPRALNILNWPDRYLNRLAVDRLKQERHDVVGLSSRPTTRCRSASARRANGELRRTSHLVLRTDPAVAPGWPEDVPRALERPETGGRTERRDPRATSARRHAPSMARAPTGSSTRASNVQRYGGTSQLRPTTPFVPTVSITIGPRPAWCTSIETWPRRRR